MKSIETRLEKLESRFNVNEEEDLSLLSDEELNAELAELFYWSIRAEKHDASDISFPDIGSEVKEMNREDFINMFISMGYDEQKRLYFDPLEAFIKKVGIEA